MVTLIKFFDKDTVKNILAPISLKPDKIVYIYDSGLKDMNYFLSLKKSLSNHMPDIVLEKVPVNVSSIDDIYYKTLQVIDDNENCSLEFTGGSELMMIAGYMAGSRKGVKLLYTDIIQGKIINLQDKKDVFKTKSLTLSDFIDAKGACFLGNSHTEPEENEYNKIINMCYYIFDHIDEWKRTCSFFQIAVSNMMSEELYLKTKRSLAFKNGKRVSPDINMLNKFLKFGFIEDLNMTKEHLRFRFSNKKYKQYMISFGVWLEMYVYINAKMSNVFDDVRLGSVIDWNVYDGINIAGNEIDVIIMDNSMPVFISCKLREADTSALNELVIARRRLGGWFSKNVIVAFGKDKQKNSGIYKRATELGIAMLDMHDIKSRDFSKILVDTIRGQDLVSLKWTKV
ncbi:MAG: DUF1887 family protein [Tyzzerella sp.]|uniref:DUF1887 family protein n=1 Tax=Candidatus Fimicola merdigallinarum TaxID=2840819 RepID=A0A9D9H358_9FIRM|nr:DUF1887 family protein [Candidatus Fimicola merdigallinarum]